MDDPKPSKEEFVASACKRIAARQWWWETGHRRVQGVVHIWQTDWWKTERLLWKTHHLHSTETRKVSPYNTSRPVTSHNSYPLLVSRNGAITPLFGRQINWSETWISFQNLISLFRIWYLYSLTRVFLIRVYSDTRAFSELDVFFKNLISLFTYKSLHHSYLSRYTCLFVGLDASGLFSNVSESGLLVCLFQIHISMKIKCL